MTTGRINQVTSERLNLNKSSRALSFTTS